MSLRRKLLLSMVIPAALLAMLGAIGIASLVHLEQAAGQILADNYQSIQQIRRMTRALRALDAPAGRAAARDAFADALSRCERNVTEPGEAALLERIRARWAADGAASPALHADLDALLALNEAGMLERAQASERTGRLMIGAVSVAAGLAFVALALFALASARRIAGPVTEVADRLHHALNPASPGQAPGGAVDEIARLRKELDALLDRLAAFEDAQAQKLSHLEGRLAFVINEVLEGLVLLDADHHVLAANRVGRAVLGMGADDQGVRLGDLTPRDDVRALLAPLLAGEVRPDRDLGEFRFALDDAERSFRPRVLPVPASAGGVEGYLLLFWDVTEQRRFEASRRRFISMLSHQLKTPMTALAMSVNLIRERLQGVDDAQRELLDIATENCSSLSALVGDLIEAARGVTPDLALSPRRIDLARLLASTLRPLVRQAEDQQVALDLPGPGAALRATVDPVKFPWVVTNIVGNALRYTPPGGRVRLTLVRDGDALEVRIADTGRGIAAADLARIFQPWVSIDEAPAAGTHGLGLAIAREVVEAHGGTLTAESTLGEGTCFIIRLPADGARA